MSKQKYYAVKAGHKTGVFNTWSECKKNVDGYSGAVYKSFFSIIEANDFINSNNNKVRIDKAEIVSYVDGSYIDTTKEFSYGVVIFYKDEEINFKQKFTNHKYKDMRNVAGEIMGATKAIEYAIEVKAKSIDIHYDYEGIEKWALDIWKANKEGTIEYKKYYKSICDKIDVKFIKVKGHSGDKYNDKADMLAKEALGLHG